ncbi:MAG: glutathione synthase [Bradymonadaceae bacterium]
MRGMTFGFVMDPLDGIILDEDTTFAFMLAAQERGHRLFYIRPEDLYADHDTARAALHPCEVQRVEGDHYELGEPEDVALGDLDCLFMRKDPPFDIDYLHASHLLELARKQGAFVLNDPTGLRVANEKLYALHFPELLPDTLVTRRPEAIESFMADHDGRCVIKPVDGYGGASIFVLDRDDRNHNSLIEMMTSEGSERVVCQEYVPEAREGDKRILLLDGEPMGAILRVPPEDDHRGNIHVGGDVVQTDLTERDREICERVGERLVDDGLWFAGIDVLGDALTEVNVTSPTGIQEMSRLDDVDGAGQVVEWAAERARLGDA